VVLDNAKEYHEYIAQCRLLTMRDLVAYLEDKGIHFDEYELVRFLKWWVKFNRIHPAIQYGPLVKRHISYSLANNISEPKSLDKIYYYRERSVFNEENLPMPDSVLEPSLQETVGTRMLEDASLRNWFSPLPVSYLRIIYIVVCVCHYYSCLYISHKLEMVTFVLFSLLLGRRMGFICQSACDYDQGAGIGCRSSQHNPSDVEQRAQEATPTRKI
jgi:hypothetical protein